MRKISLVICLLFVLSAFSGCKNNSENSTTTTTEEPRTTVSTTKVDVTADVTETEISTKNQSSTFEDTTREKEETVSPESTTEITTVSVFEELENSEVVTYYSENPNNKYICAVAEKYGVDKVNLVALIRTKAQNPGATVLQFSGKTDENGELIKTKSELKYVYEVDDSDSTIKRAAENSLENDGYSASESRTIFMLTKQFIVPELEKFKKKHTYPE